MPNPFVKLGAGANRGHQPPTHPQPVEPIPEHYAGTNHPYRGMEDHGVPDNAKPEEFSGYEGTLDAHFEFESEPETVVPVRIVRDNAARQRIVLRSSQTQLTVGRQSASLLGRNDRRVKAYITLQNANPADLLFIGGTNEQVSSIQGYPLKAGTEWTTQTQGVIYGVIPVAAGGSAVDTVLTVFIVEEVAVDL